MFPDGYHPGDLCQVLPTSVHDSNGRAAWNTVPGLPAVATGGKLASAAPVRLGWEAGLFCIIADWKWPKLVGGSQESAREYYIQPLAGRDGSTCD